MDQSSNKRRAGSFHGQRQFILGLGEVLVAEEGALESHVPGSSLGHDIVFLLLDLEQSVVNLRADEAASLSVHGLGAQCSGHEVDFGVILNLALDQLSHFRSPFLHLHLHGGVFLGANTLTLSPVMVHTGLAVLGGVDSVTVTVHDLAQFV